MERHQEWIKTPKWSKKEEKTRFTPAIKMSFIIMLIGLIIMVLECYYGVTLNLTENNLFYVVGWSLFLLGLGFNFGLEN